MMLRWWPRTLFGRLVIILAIGMFAGQLLTSTIWFDTHDNRTLEIPVRLFASRLADTVRLAGGADSAGGAAADAAARRAEIAKLSDARYQLQWIDAPQPQPDLSVANRAVEDLLATVLNRRLGMPVTVHLLDVHLRDEPAGHRGIFALFDSRMPSGEFHVQLRVPDGAWLDVRASEGQAGMLTEPGSLVLDYLLRIYLIRLVAVFVLALVAVRFAVKPLKDLAKAAQNLGRNINRPPLPIEGPLEVRSAAQSLNAMQQQLIDSIAERMRFLAAVSHDLRTPITRLRLRAEMLPDPEQRERFRTDLEDMEAMVRATLEYVRGSDVSEPRRLVDIDSLLRALLDDFAETGARVALTGRANRPFDGYPRNLKRCLQNLLENAIRYGGCALVAIDDTHRELRIVVSDEGPGIHGDGMLERVFEPYFRIEGSRNAATGGTGLGLAIARAIAVAHGGTLVLANRPDKGLDAILTLPRESA